jgi:AcrR family transcriptional regulator
MRYALNSVHRPEAQAESEDLKVVILAAARELATAIGYDRLSMRMLAQRIGCSPGTIYLYFASKSELLNRLVEESFGRLSQVLTGLADRHRRGDPVQLLKKVLYTCVDFGMRHPNEYRAACCQSAQDCPIKITAPVVLRSVVMRCIDEEAFLPDVDPDCVSLALWADRVRIRLLLREEGEYLPYRFPSTITWSYQWSWSR